MIIKGLTQGEVVFLTEWTDNERSSRIRKIRPWVVISNNEFHIMYNMYLCIPVTHANHKGSICVDTDSNGLSSYVLPWQIRYTDKSEVLNRIGKLDYETLGKVLSAVSNVFLNNFINTNYTNENSILSCQKLDEKRSEQTQDTIPINIFDEEIEEHVADDSVKIAKNNIIKKFNESKPMDRDEMFTLKDELSSDLKVLISAIDDTEESTKLLKYLSSSVQPITKGFMELLNRHYDIPYYPFKKHKKYIFSLCKLPDKFASNSELYKFLYAVYTNNLSGKDFCVTESKFSNICDMAYKRIKYDNYDLSFIK